MPTNMRMKASGKYATVLRYKKPKVGLAANGINAYRKEQVFSDQIHILCIHFRTNRIRR